MPELPPPPPPPLSLIGVVADWLTRLRTRLANHATGDIEDSSDGRIARPRWSAQVAVAMVAILLAVAVVGGLAVVRLGGSPPPPELVLPRARSASTGSSDGATPSTHAPKELFAHAAGAVAQPGVFNLKVGARVADLVAAAGGASPDADLNAINLAAKLEDGQRVYVPRRGEAPVDVAGVAAVGGAAGDSPQAPLNLNTATIEQLDALPGIGMSIAQAIIDYRQEKGRFRSVDELLEVRGIGAAKLGALKKKVRV